MKFFAKNIALTLTATALAMFAVTASADTKAQQLKNLAHYQAAAGESIESFPRLSLRNISWQPLGDQNLFYQTSQSKGYLITTDQPCLNLDIAMAVSVSGDKSVHVRSDKVTVLGSDNPGRFECRISDIRPVDIKKYREIRAADKANK